jgi:hypothetical protein
MNGHPAFAISVFSGRGFRNTLEFSYSHIGGIKLDEHELI